MKDQYKLNVDGSYGFLFRQGDVEDVDWTKTGEAAYHLIDQSESFHIVFEEADIDNRQYRVNVNGTSHYISIENPLDLLIAELGFELGAGSKVSQVEAPMPGLVLELSVAEGQQVSEGDTLLILEAMKMENAIASPREGTVKAVAVKQGDAVEKKQVLIIFE